MKIFISSVISGFETFRVAARSAVTTLRHEPVMAESFSAQPNSPQVACLQALRSSDLVVLIIGERYGVVAGSSGVSPTHEEFLEARDSKPLFVFVQDGVIREDRQALFLKEVSQWNSGFMRQSFSTPDQLKELITRCIHDYQLAHAVAPLDLNAIKKAALHLLPQSDNRNSIQSAKLNLVMAGGPLQQIVRPAEIEDEKLINAFHKQAFFGELPIFDRLKATTPRITLTGMFLEQEGGACILLTEQGALRLTLPLENLSRRGRDGFGGGFALIEEIVIQQLIAAIAYSAWTLENIDPTQRLTHVTFAATINASEHLGWRTRAEDEASPNSGTMGFGGGEKRLPVSVDCPRAALRFNAARLAEDLMVPLRRQRKLR